MAATYGRTRISHCLLWRRCTKVRSRTNAQEALRKTTRRTHQSFLTHLMVLMKTRRRTQMDIP
jgi:hypothetical protein